MRSTLPVLLLVLGSLWAIVPLGRAEVPESTIWGEPILQQPFDRGIFRQVRIPAWVQETIGCGYTLSGMDSQGRARAAAHGVTISEMGIRRSILCLL